MRPFLGFAVRLDEFCAMCRSWTWCGRQCVQAPAAMRKAGLLRETAPDVQKTDDAVSPNPEPIPEPVAPKAKFDRSAHMKAYWRKRKETRDGMQAPE